MMCRIKIQDRLWIKLIDAFATYLRDEPQHDVFA